MIDEKYKRLRERLEEYGEEDIITVSMLDEGETLDNIREEERYELTEKDANELLSFYISAAARIEAESTLIINACVFDYGMIRKGSFEFIQEQLTQSNREDMLYYLGLIDEGLKGEMARVRQKRNELAHTDRHNQIEDLHRIKNDIKRANEVVKKIVSIEQEIEHGEFNPTDE